MNIVIGITGGIAAYKTPLLIRLLTARGHNVKCVATAHALQFVTPLTLETVSGNKLYSDLFAPANEHTTEHISLKDWCDMLIVAPATANIIGKMASGIADDALSTLLLSVAPSKVVLCPAMNTQMWEGPVLQRNMAALATLGVRSIGPASGALACGATGAGRMEEPEAIAEEVGRMTATQRLALKGKRVLVTAGPTYERIDPVRFIGNHSSGKMGFALANVLAAAGAAVELVAGPVDKNLWCDPRIHRTDVESARQMFDAATLLYPACDAAILAAAVADYRPAVCAEQKMKKQGSDGLTIALVQNPDILATLGKNKRQDQLLVGFALETNDEDTHALDKLNRKNLDYIVLNSLRDKGAGFGVDTNKVTIFGRDGGRWDSPLRSKQEIAADIVGKIFGMPVADGC